MAPYAQSEQTLFGEDLGISFSNRPLPNQPLGNSDKGVK